MIAEQVAAAGRYIYAIVNDDGESAWETDRRLPLDARAARLRLLPGLHDRGRARGRGGQ